MGYHVELKVYSIQAVRLHSNCSEMSIYKKKICEKAQLQFLCSFNLINSVLEVFNVIVHTTLIDFRKFLDEGIF